MTSAVPVSYRCKIEGHVFKNLTFFFKADFNQGPICDFVVDFTWWVMLLCFLSSISLKCCHASLH